MGVLPHGTSLSGCHLRCSTWSGRLAVPAAFTRLQHFTAPSLSFLHFRYPHRRVWGRHLLLRRGGFSSILLCLGGVAMHPPTFCTLLRSYTFYYERDLKAHKDFLDEKRPDKKTRPANYTQRTTQQSSRSTASSSSSISTIGVPRGP